MKTRLLGEVSKPEIKRLIRIGAIVPFHGDYAFKSKKVKEITEIKRRGIYVKIPSGRIISVLSDEAKKIIFPTKEEKAAEKNMEGIIQHQDREFRP